MGESGESFKPEIAQEKKEIPEPSLGNNPGANDPSQNVPSDVTQKTKPSTEKPEGLEQNQAKPSEKLSPKGMQAIQGIPETPPETPMKKQAAEIEEQHQDVGGKPFEIKDWQDYPNDVPKPDGQIKIIDGKEYKDARNEADNANKKIHREHPEYQDMDIHEILPVRFGGSPTDPGNKIALTPEKHQEVSLFWDKKLRENNK